jgi:hypothetical protein
MPRDVEREALQKRWLHSHEEDTDTERVYRPASFSFPRSRGRTGFELRPDKTLVDVGIAPTDAPRELAGTWDLQGEGEKSLLLKPAGAAPTRLDIISVSPDRLVVRK